MSTNFNSVFNSGKVLFSGVNFVVDGSISGIYNKFTKTLNCPVALAIKQLGCDRISTVLGKRILFHSQQISDHNGIYLLEDWFFDSNTLVFKKCNEGEIVKQFDCPCFIDVVDNEGNVKSKWKMCFDESKNGFCVLPLQ